MTGQCPITLARCDHGPCERAQMCMAPYVKPPRRQDDPPIKEVPDAR